MPEQTRDVAPGENLRSVISQDGQVLSVPTEWELLPPGDAGMTRRVKSLGPTWTVKEKKGRRTFSKGVWADASQIATARTQLEAERSTEAYAKRKSSDAARREKKQAKYVDEFELAVLSFLDFHPSHGESAKRLAKEVTEHATPVGSGTVARTQRIPVQRRAESAVIAWMRHQTTAYDNMTIPRVKGKRREVRRMLAEQSRKLLAGYRKGERVDVGSCPLHSALKGKPNAAEDS